MINDLIGAVSSDGVDQIYCHALRIDLLWITDLREVDEVWNEFVAIRSEVLLDVEYHRDQALQHLLSALEGLLFHDGDYSVSDVVEALIEHLDWTVQHYLCEAKDCSGLYHFAR